MVSNIFSCLKVEVGLVTANANKALYIKNIVNAEQINVKIFLILMVSCKYMKHIFSFDIVEFRLITKNECAHHQSSVWIESFTGTFQVATDY